MSVVTGAPAYPGVSDDVLNLALGLVLRLPEELTSWSESADTVLCTQGCATFRFAQRDDIDLICDMRCAQSLEYWEVAPTTDSLRLFRAETEAYLRRNLNTRVFFAVVERGGECVSLSGLEVADRLPTIDAQGGSERRATVVACYTPPVHRGRGYMRQMLSVWATMAPLVGIDTLYLESHNATMQRLACAVGFELSATKYRLKLGYPDAFALAVVS